jgi:hypothetical protein
VGSSSSAAADRTAEHELLLLLGLGALPTALRANLSDTPLQVVPDSLMGPPAEIKRIQSPLGQIHEPLYEGSEDWAPRPIGKFCRWDQLFYDDFRVRGYRVEFVHTWVVGVKYAGLVAGVRVGFNGTLDDCVKLESDLLFARNRISLTSTGGGAPLDLHKAILAGLDSLDQDSSLDLEARFRRTRDFNIVFTTRTLDLLRQPPNPQAAHSELERHVRVDLHALRRLLYKGTSDRYRPQFSPIELPQIGNGQPWKLVALFADTTVLAGWNDPNHEGAMGKEAGQMQVACLLGLAASVQSREVRADAYRALAQLQAGTDTNTFQALQGRRRQLGELASELRSLQLRHHLGVVTYLDLHMARPTVAVAEYYRSLVKANRLDTNATTTTDVIGRLADAIAAESAAVAAEEQVRLNSTTEAVRGASIAAGAVALLVAAVGLFAALAAAPKPTAQNELLLRGWPAAASAAGLTVVVAAALGLGMSALTRWAAGRQGRETLVHRAARVTWVVLIAAAAALFTATIIYGSAILLVIGVALLTFSLVLYVVSQREW